jgi:hypothetical protein
VTDSVALVVAFVSDLASSRHGINTSLHINGERLLKSFSFARSKKLYKS